MKRDDSVILRKKKTAALGVAAIAGAAALAVPAGAAISVPSFTQTPSTTQAGASPDLVSDITLAPTATDDVKEVTLSLAPGLLANPTVAPACTEADLEADACQATSQIGTGTVTATVPGLLGSTTVDSPAKLYNVVPRAGEAGRVGMVTAAAGGLARFATSGPVALRTTPDVGADIAFKDLPRKLGSTEMQVTRLQLTVKGTVNGKPFTRNPTSCAPATTKLRVVSYEATESPVTAESTFTPTGCATLPFAPKLTASATVSGWDGATELTTTISQAGGEAAAKRARLTLPSGLTPRSATMQRACASSDPAACPASANVGTANAKSPLLAQPLAGRVVLLSSPNGQPRTAVVFPAPFPIILIGTSTTSGNRLVTTYDNQPDVPLSDVTVKLDGGPSSLLVNGWSMCFGAPAVQGDFLAHSARTAPAPAPVAVTGCR
jgi:hypothetical protein